MSAYNRSPDEAAAAWMTRRDAGWSELEQVEFQKWLVASPTHALAWAKVEAAWCALDRPLHEGLADAFALQLAIRHRRKVRRYVFGSVGLAAAVAMMLVLPAERAEVPHSGGHPSPYVVRAPQQVLPDGSVVDLNRNAEIVVEYDSTRRGVRLIRGEAHFEVKHEAARPFVVTASGVDVRAVGTAFVVRVDPDALDVLVTKGRVAVERPDEAANVSERPPLASVTISAGDRVSVPTGGVAPLPQPESLSEAEIARRLHWRGPRLDLSGTRLADAIAMLNRENRVQVTVADAELAQMRMSGLFRLDDVEGFVDVLATNYGVIVERSGNEILLRQSTKR